MASSDSAIFVGLGANLPADGYDSPRTTLEAALQRLDAVDGVSLRQVSPWYESAPVPVSEQPWFVNGVAQISTELSPTVILGHLHDIEEEFGRVRRIRNEARVLDMDLIVHGRTVDLNPKAGAPILPHPRMHQRAFVLLPLSDLAPGWVHPVTGTEIEALKAELPQDQVIRRLDREAGV